MKYVQRRTRGIDKSKITPFFEFLSQILALQTTKTGFRLNFNFVL
jgi:hypothetical protein